MVVIEMENGKKIKIELYPEIAPISCENFEKLVKQGFYDGLIFHRVIPGFMIQGGCSVGVVDVSSTSCGTIFVTSAFR